MPKIDCNMQASLSRRPIFILGMTQRVGTNFLARALSQHPACTVPGTLHEDFLISRFPLLDEYVDVVQVSWNSEWGAREKTPQLRRKLGNAILDFILADAAEPDKRLIMKTPTIFGLALARMFIPESDIIVLIRNGPDVIESGMRTFEWQFEEACQMWGDAAHYLLELCNFDVNSESHPFMIVRYEDLVTDPDATFKRVLSYTKLDASDFDASTIHELPLYGSSTERGGADRVHWSPVPKPADFDPLKRSRGWSEEAFERFDWITRSVSTQLGYDIPHQYRDRMDRRFWYWLGEQKLRLPRRLQERLRYSPSRERSMGGRRCW